MANNRSRDDVDVMLRSLGLVDFDYVDERPSDAPWRPQDGKSAKDAPPPAAGRPAEKSKAPPPASEAPSSPRHSAPATPARAATAAPAVRPRTSLSSPARTAIGDAGADDLPLSTLFARLEGTRDVSKPKLRLNLGAKRSAASNDDADTASRRDSDDLQALFARAESAGTAPARRFLPTRKR